jgi:cell division septation protein DedD
VRSFRWAPIAGWCAATATSIVLASVALMPVLRTAAPEDTALSGIDQLPAGQSNFPAPLPAATDVSVSPAPHKTRKPPASSSPSASALAKSGSPTTSPTTNPSATTEDGWTVTTGADGLRTYVRSFRVAGGQAVIKMTSDGVVLLVTATPADGYAVQKTQDSPGNLAVYFNETNHSFIIHAVWFTDKPFVEVSEVGK